MLVTPNLPTQEKIDEWNALFKQHGLNHKYEPPIVHREGVILGHLNINHDIDSKYEDYPLFHADDGTIENYKEILTKPIEEGREYYYKFIKEKIALLESVPANVVSFYNKEKWQHYYDRYSEAYRANEPFEEYEPSLNSYGVVDSPEQLLEMYDFHADPRKFFICLTPMFKGEQPSDGGWRWHKWGPYIGIHTPTCEYLYDEPEIDVVWVYHIRQLID